MVCMFLFEISFFFNDTATTEIYTYGHTLSLHDALPISRPRKAFPENVECFARPLGKPGLHHVADLVGSVERSVDFEVSHRIAVHFLIEDRKSKRLNSSH